MYTIYQRSECACRRCARSVRSALKCENSVSNSIRAPDKLSPRSLPLYSISSSVGRPRTRSRVVAMDEASAKVKTWRRREVARIESFTTDALLFPRGLRVSLLCFYFFFYTVEVITPQGWIVRREHVPLQRCNLLMHKSCRWPPRAIAMCTRGHCNC